MDDTPTQWGVLLGRGFARPCGWLSFGARACAAAAVHGPIVSWGGLDGEKTRAVPNRPGNRPRDRRQAGIGGALPDKTLRRGRDGVAAALIIAHEHVPILRLRSPLRAPSRRTRPSSSLRVARSSVPNASS